MLALDARVRIGRVPQTRFGTRDRRGGGHPGFAIRPYPVEWVRILNLKDRTVRVRPVRPEDEDLFRVFFENLDPESLRLRFFGPVRAFSHAFLTRLTQLDYARAIAFVAVEIGPDGRERMLGAVRLHADANNDSGEYAIGVGQDVRGTGLAFALMRLMIDWARSEGIGRVEGTVLRRTARCSPSAAASASPRSATRRIRGDEGAAGSGGGRVSNLDNSYRHRHDPAGVPPCPVVPISAPTSNATSPNWEDWSLPFAQRVGAARGRSPRRGAGEEARGPGCALARGLADAEAGRVAPIGDVADRLRAKYRAMEQNRNR